MNPEREGPVSTGMDGGTTAANHCRQAANTAIRAFVSLLMEAESDGRIPLAAVARIAEIMVAKNGPMADFYRRAEAAVRADGERGANAFKRTEHLNRLIAEPFAHLLDSPDGGVDRRHLRAFFAAIRALLGEDSYLDLQKAAETLAERHRGEDRLVDWMAFHKDPDSRAIVDDVLVTLARAFHNFELRWDWLLARVNAPDLPAAGDPPPPLSEPRLARVLLALFSSMRAESFDTERARAFAARWGAMPEKVFGALFVELKRRAES